MPNFNLIVLCGHATRDVETWTTANGSNIAKTGIAVNGWKENDVLFIDVTGFNKTANAMTKFISKGSAFQVRGRLQLEQWEDKNGGGKRSRHTVIADEIVLMGGKQQQAERHDGEPETRPATTSPVQDNDNEIPF